MLKFADLGVDFVELLDENVYMKTFPNSYMPLLMMYLGRYNLLEIVENPVAEDEQIFNIITTAEISEFFSRSKYERPYNEVWFEFRDILDKALNKNVAIDYYDVISSFPVFLLLKYRDSHNIKRIGMRIKADDKHRLLDIQNKLCVKEDELRNISKVYYFLFLWSISTKSFISDITKGNNSQTEKWIEKFDETLAKIQAYSRDKMWMQPEELTRIILSKKHNGRVFNPFAGLASYSVNGSIDDSGFYIKDKTLGDDYYGQEIDSISWAVGKLRLLAYGSDSDNYINSDSTLWTDKNFPNILSTPPFGLKLQNEIGEMEFADHFVLRRSIDTMRNGGMTACVVPASFLTRKDTYELRMQLVREKLLNTVVLLPEGVFLPYTNIKTAIVFLERETNNTVKFVDASIYFKEKGRERKL